jgi:hypothetical protein
MSHAKFARHLANLTAEAARAASEAADMIEIDEGGAPEIANVLAVTGKLRDRLLWIERSLAGVAQKEQDHG